MPASRSARTSSHRFSRRDPGHVGVRKLVHDGHSRVPANDGVGVHFLEARAPVLDKSPRDRLQSRRPSATVSLRPCGSKYPITRSTPFSFSAWASLSI